MIETQVMKNHKSPVIVLKFPCDIAGDIVVHLGEILWRVVNIATTKSR